jgi:hypothetical protein
MDIPTGYLETLTPKERETMLQIRAFLRETYGIDCKKVWNHWNILRFCRARKFVLNDIIIMIKDYMNWCTEIQMSQIGELDIAQFNVLKANYAHGYYNTDIVGRPLYIQDARRLKADVLFKNYSDDHLKKYYVQSYERLLHIIFPECSRVVGRRIDTTVGIIELKDSSIIKLFTGKVKSFLNIAVELGQNYYPETMGTMYVLHAGFLFSGIWSVVKMWLDIKTQKKTNIISGNGRDELFKIIRPENLPVFLGGTCTRELTDDFGPWSTELQRSYANKTVFHSDPKLIQHFYWDEEEKAEERAKEAANSQGYPPMPPGHMEGIHQQQEHMRLDSLNHPHGNYGQPPQ